MFKGMGNMQQIMQQAKKMNEQMEKVRKEVEKAKETATAGGGIVEVTVNGRMEVEKITIDPEVIKDGDVEMIEDLVTAAVNEGLRKIQALTKDSYAQLTGGLPIPGMGL